MGAVEPVSLKLLRSFASTPIDPEEPDYIKPLQLHVRRLSRKAGAECEFVLLGSISTKKYAEVLIEYFGSRVAFSGKLRGARRYEPWRAFIEVRRRRTGS